jgi:multisubunit Na+/H+ antiporter MnhC subunit
MKNNQTLSSVASQPSLLKWIAILMGLTFMRALTITMIPTLEMYGGENPNAWFGPWISDTILGLLIPIIIYLLLKKRGVKIWGMLLMYNAIGAFDFMHGLITEWTDPLIPNGIFGTPALTYGSVSFSLVVQIIVIVLLFNSKIISYFTEKS